MKKNNIRTMLSAIALIVCGIVGVIANNITVYAAGRAIALSPMSQRIILAPGETYTGGFTVANPASATEDLRYLVEVVPFYPVSRNEGRDDYGDADYTTKSSYNSIVDWITIDNPIGIIQPDGNVTVTFEVTVPENVPAGGQYAAFLVRENPEAIGIDDSVSVNEIMQMAHIIYAEVTGETVREGKILDNSFPSFLLDNTLNATSMVRNDGNIHTDAEYILQVWPLGSDEEICTNEENLDTELVLPNTQRYHLETCQLPSVGIFRAKHTVKIFGEESVVEKMVIVCPIWLLFLIIFIIIALIIWIVMKVRSRGKKSRKESRQSTGA